MNISAKAGEWARYCNVDIEKITKTLSLLRNCRVYRIADREIQLRVGSTEHGDVLIAFVEAEFAAQTLTDFVILPSDTATRPDMEDPLYLLSALALEFAFFIDIGGKQRPFFSDVTLGASSDKPFERFVVINEGKRYRLQSWPDGVEARASDRFLFVYALDLDMYLRWLLQRDRPNRQSRVFPVPSVPDPVVRYANGAATKMLDDTEALLSKMQSNDGLNSLARINRLHPMVRQRDALAAMRKVMNTPGTRMILPDIYAVVELQFAQHSWAQTVSRESFWSFIRDPNVLKKVQTNLRSAGYWDVTTELYIWALLRERGVTSQLTEETSMPDLTIWKSSSVTFAGEIKCVHGDVKNIGNAIRKANKQIKEKSPERSGIAFVRLIREVPLYNSGDTLPKDYEPYKAALQRALAPGINRSVAKIVLLWDDYHHTGNPLSPRFHWLIRHSTIVSHPSPRAYDGLADQYLNFGMSVVMMMV